VDAQHEHRKGGTPAPDLVQRIQATLPRHDNVEHDHIPGLLLNAIEDLRAILGFAQYGKIGFGGQDLLQAAADQGMVIGYQNANHVTALRPGTGGREIILKTALAIVPAFSLDQLSDFLNGESRETKRLLRFVTPGVSILYTGVSMLYIGLNLSVPTRSAI
jgi:hypothetical protein